MIIRKLNNKDQKSLDKFLVDYTESCMFIRSNMKRVGLEYQDGSYYGEYFGALDRSNNFIGVISHYWNGNVMMQASDRKTLNSLICYFQENIVRPIKAVLGPDDQAELVIQKFGMSSQEYLMNDPNGLYVVKLEDLVKPHNFDFKRAKRVPLNSLNQDIIRKWIKAFMIEALQAEEGTGLEENVEKRVERTLEEKTASVLLYDEIPVTLSGYNATLKEAVQIGSVYTPPEYRKRGFARALLYLSLKQTRETGAKKAVLFANDPAAVKAYKSIGFKRIGTYRLALLKKSFTLPTQNKCN